MSKLDELLKQEEQLEQERMNYLEAEDNKGAKRIEKKLYRIRDLIEFEHQSKDIEIKNKLLIYQDFIDRRGLKEQFEIFYNKEISKYL